jgi:hypothetical protein
MGDEPNTRDELNKIHEAIATLSDGKWDRRDALAVATILGSLAGLITAAVMTLQGLGMLSTSDAAEPAPYADTDGDTDTDR